MNRTQIRYRWVLLAVALSGLMGVHSAWSQALPDFTQLVEDHGPAVVNISTTKKAVGLRGTLPHGLEIPDLPEDSPMRELFRHFFGETPGSDLPERETLQLGSGFVISPDGYIVTNFHVVEGAEKIVARFSDRRELVAEVVGTDKRSDIALLKVDAQGLQAVQIGRAKNLKAGEWVVAIGSPFGYTNSVTAGIVSAKGRSLPGENYVPFIQTDVAINRGNSGGPLFNLDGRVVGVNSQILSRTGGFMGVSFAIPIELAMNVVEQIKEKGYVTRGWLGVLIQDVTRELAESFGMSNPYGALVSKVYSDSPAAKAGFQPGDVVVEFDGQAVMSSAALPPMVGSTAIDRTVNVKVIRSGAEQELEVTIGELPDDKQLKLSRGMPPAGARPSNQLGVIVEEPSAELRQELGIESGGVLVKNVMPGPADRAGVSTGDVILMLDNQRVKDVEHFTELAAALPADRSVAALVQRKDGPLFLALRLDETE
jgi:serine protease Do